MYLVTTKVWRKWSVSTPAPRINVKTPRIKQGTNSRRAGKDPAMFWIAELPEGDGPHFHRDESLGAVLQHDSFVTSSPGPVGKAPRITAG